MRRRKGARSKKEADGSTARVARSLTNEEMDDISSGCESDLNDGRGIVVPIWDNSLGEGLQKHPREWLTAALAPRNLATLIYALSYTVSLPILPFMARKFLYEDDLSLRGLSEAWRGPMYGVVMSAYYLTKMVAAPLLGFLSDRIGRRLSLLLTLWGSAATFLLTFAVGQHSLEGLILCRMLMGCFGANGALMMAYVRDTVPREQQASAFAQHSAAWGLAYAMAGPLLTAVKEDIGTSLCLAASFMALAACVVGIFFVETVSPNGKPTAQKDADSAITKSATGSAAVVEWVEKGSKVEANGHIRARKKSFKELESDGKEAGGSITPKRGKRGWKRAQLRAMVRVFQLMLSERMVLGLFALQVLRPAQDLAPLINSKFGGGASVVALLSSIRAAIRVFLPMSPLMPMLSSCFSCKGRSQEQADRMLAAASCMFMAAATVAVPVCPTLWAMYFIMIVKGSCFVVKESTASAVMSDLASSGNIGAFFGWQHFVKGFAGVMGNMITGWLSSVQPELPYIVTAVCDILGALTYLYA